MKRSNYIELEKLLIIIIFISFLVRILFFHPSFSDENFYFNAGKIVSEGKIPYKDFFFAHPPMQIYTYALIFKIFGTSLFVGKIIPLVASSLSIFLIFKILNKLYDSRTGFIGSIIFLVMPGFIAFSSMGYGMWESIFFILLAIYSTTKNKVDLAAVSLVIGLFFRYLIVIYLPFLILLMYVKKLKLKRFLFVFFSLSLVLLSLMFLIFGWNCINQTILFHIVSKVITKWMEKLVWQYLSMGFFTFFLGLISIYVAFDKKDKLLLLFSVYPLIIDMIIFFGLNYIAYHYFLISLSFIAIATARALTVSKDKLLYLIIPVILILSLTSNFKTIDFYLNPIHAESLYSAAEFIANNTSEEDSIFGEPVLTNYVSFVTDRRMGSNYYDSYLRHLIFEGEEKVIQSLNRDKPKFIIEAGDYYLSNVYFRDFILNNYEFVKDFEGTPRYSIYQIIA
jgi:4-amino-4-deoxy-L-arabinose transferase-like glycosyltransferase